MRDCRWEGSESDGGTYEVCVVDHPWLVGQVTQANLRCAPGLVALRASGRRALYVFCVCWWVAVTRRVTVRFFFAGTTDA